MNNRSSAYPGCRQVRSVRSARARLWRRCWCHERQSRRRSGAGGPAADELPADIAKILKEKCALCHGEEASFGAPMSLTKPSHFQVEAPIAGGKLTDVTKTRINATDPPSRHAADQRKH